MRKADGEGFEAVSVNGNADNSLQKSANQGEAESEAVWPDSDLKAVVEAWPSLPAAIKAGILALVRAAR